jgi:hypothetical protein
MIKRAQLAESVSAAWQKIARKTLKQLFKKYSITNALYGTEDDMRKF